MPTLIDLDSFQHKTLATTWTSATGWAHYDAVVNGGTVPNHGGGAFSFDTVTKRTADHNCSLKMVLDGITASSISRNFAAGIRHVIASMYFRVAAAPSASSNFFVFNSTTIGRVTMTTAGFIRSEVGANNVVGAVNYADGNWHKLDAHYDTSGANALLDVQVDGLALTQNSVVSAAADITLWRIGSQNTAHTLTAWFNDLAISSTVVDYPMADHVCLMSVPTGEGTDNLNAHISGQDAGTTNLYQYVDDWVSGGTPDTTTYIRQTVIGTGDYAEFTMSDPVTNSGEWACRLLAQGIGTTALTACDITHRLVDSAGTTIQNGPTDVSATVTEGYTRAATVAAAPAVGGLAGMKVRLGFSTDITPEPRIGALAVEYAVSTAAAAVGSLVWDASALTPAMIGQ
jgi:hypothetical protein